LDAAAQVSAGEYENLSISFTTGSTYRHVRVVLEQYKGSGGSLSVQNVSLLAEGGEWLDTPQPAQEPTTEVLYDDFLAGLDPEIWLVVDKAWGGDNGGLVPENVEIQDGVLLLHAHGDQYDGDVVGHNDRTTRVGAGIATRDYYASGSYEVHARIPETSGAASAFWTFHYVEHFPSEEEYWQEPSRVRNSEIDWEFPTALQTGESHDPISFDNARVNSWGGKLGGEGAHHPGRVEVVNDGEFHTYGIDWHSGGDGELPRVIWTIDGEEVYRHEGALFGQDNIPSQASRFWLGIWFPAAGYKEQLDGQYVERVGWAGDPDFDQASLEIDWVRITPFNEANDRWEPETWPNGWYALPHEYPGFLPDGQEEKREEETLFALDAVLTSWPGDPLH
jgi:beta-glucanase (GH16 family)